ncbi:hypothetical protein [Microcoleus sp. D2_18a_D3]|uniref:hypothetical protein n=1 Tax=Microcoleus sp. D2_18a_D3 TaxID=3055330 RepID=UPI002FD533B9
MFINYYLTIKQFGHKPPDSAVYLWKKLRLPIASPGLIRASNLKSHISNFKSHDVRSLILDQFLSLFCTIGAMLCLVWLRKF